MLPGPAPIEHVTSHHATCPLICMREDDKDVRAEEGKGTWREEGARWKARERCSMCERGGGRRGEQNKYSQKFDANEHINVKKTCDQSCPEHSLGCNSMFQNLRLHVLIPQLRRHDATRLQTRTHPADLPRK